MMCIHFEITRFFWHHSGSASSMLVYPTFPWSKEVLAVISPCCCTKYKHILNFPMLINFALGY